MYYLSPQTDNALGEVAFDNYALLITLTDIVTPEPPSNVQVSVQTTAVSITWPMSPSPDGVAYRLYLHGDWQAQLSVIDINVHESVLTMPVTVAVVLEYGLYLPLIQR